MTLATKSDKQMAEVKEGLAEGFEVKDMGELHHFQGVKVKMKCGSVKKLMPREFCRNLE